MKWGLDDLYLLFSLLKMQDQFNRIEVSSEIGPNMCGDVLHNKGSSDHQGKVESLVNEVGSTT